MNIIFLIILFPLISFLFLSLIQGTISERNAAIIGISSIFIAFIITCFYMTSFVNHSSQIFTQKLCSWISVNELNIDFSLILDGLSLSMLSMIIGIGLLIHIFSSWYMEGKEGYSRFFAYTNLFIASMSLLVLADNFVFMYLGWEIVSVCSYLLIGFYYKTSNNNSCALKAFILTRISDVFLIVSIFLIYKKYGTFNFQEIKFLSKFLNIQDCSDLNFLTLCLLIGVIGKSAQLPLHTWLSDAMVGPTPVSALIHAATMVTAGVYLIARTHFLFLLTPKILYLISFIGIITIFISSFSALVQTDIKRILAYSTMSQIGYMFLALGVQAWTAAILHLIIHAIFKALLFLSSGSLILSCNNEKNIFKMSNLSSKCPLLYASFLVGGASLISFPLITAGFYSKGNVLFSVLQNGYVNFFLVGLFCSLLTSIYTFRMIFVVFHRSSISFVFSNKRLAHNLPLLILLFFSTFFGYFIIKLPLFYIFPVSQNSENGKFLYEIISSFMSFFGIFIAYYIWIKNPNWIFQFLQLKAIRLIHNFLLNGWCFDFFYKILFINSYLFISKILSYESFNFFPIFFVKFIKKTNLVLLKSVNGNVKHYISTMLIGINLFFILVLCSFLS
ncbi:NADH-quinone oxidoreductase subunit L [Buchnera aphidicola (Rhopalosiphum padi)]|uniref:NADH-quinone oxidoreductase subunit L n=1 Tax=Buchnera aphidicola subsp. Rhopalosiphum padi TaxID=98793 RepID=A0A4D6YGI6_BUCRP|nr:NADH-quinone oxidoreductase subunit L [Buchnera aphidicola]QCI24818.1 NADH-quinone oxidoreductase subunit L [Buchnera aphidicola (Rhopalosiphum padi)]